MFQRTRVSEQVLSDVRYISPFDLELWDVLIISLRVDLGHGGY